MAQFLPLAERSIGKTWEEALDLWHARMGQLGHWDIKLLAKLSKGIESTKMPKVKNPMRAVLLESAALPCLKSKILWEEAPNIHDRITPVCGKLKV